MEQEISTKVFARLTIPSTVLARIGLILLSTDEVGGDAFASIMPKKEVSVFQTRTDYDYGDRRFSMPTSFTEVANTLPPAGRLDVLAFSCTCWTVAIGAQNMLSQLAETRPGIAYTTPAHAAAVALKRIKAKKIALLSPYELPLHQLIRQFFRDSGFEVASDGVIARPCGVELHEVNRESLFTAATQLVRSSSPDALFICCTAMPIVPHIDCLEKELGIPLLTSTQAMAWDALRLAGYGRPIDGYGQLLASER